MNQVATRERSPLVQFKGDLQRLHDAGELALPDTVPFKNFKNAMTVAITDNAGILQCNRESIFKAVRTLAAAGLVPDGREAAIVPFKGTAQAMPMVAGLVKVARNSGKITSLWADVVYEGETLDVWVEEGERRWKLTKLDGTPVDVLDRGDKVRGAYAVAKLTDGTVELEIMGHRDIEKRRRASANQKGDNPTGIWAQWPEEMAKKTVIRNLCKRLPMSADDMERLYVEQEPLLQKDVTPSEAGQGGPRVNLAQRLMAEQDAAPDAAQEATDQSPPDESQDIEGEVLPDAAPDPFSDAYKAGAAAFKAGDPPDCPDDMDPAQWRAGYDFEEKGDGK